MSYSRALFSKEQLKKQIGRMQQHNVKKCDSRKESNL